jgi:hypothetical protein
VLSPLSPGTTLATAVSYEPVKPELRASDADREAAVERLHAAAMEGRLDADELEERLSQAYAARWCSELAHLTADVTPPPEPLVFVRPTRRLNPFAIASIVLAVFWFAWLGSVAAVITGHIALGQIARSGGTQYGRTPAILGLALGYFGLAVLLAFIVW